jgi:hypothetical protein
MQSFSFKMETINITLFLTIHLNIMPSSDVVNKSMFLSNIHKLLSQKCYLEQVDLPQPLWIKMQAIIVKNLENMFISNW